MQQVLEAAGDPGVASVGRVDVVIDRLRRAGWLLPLRTRGCGISLQRRVRGRSALAIRSPTRDGALGGYRLLAIELGLRAATALDAVPVHSCEALLVSMAVKPGGYRDWPNVGLWLAQACALVVADRDDRTGTLIAPRACRG